MPLGGAGALGFGFGVGHNAPVVGKLDYAALFAKYSAYGVCIHGGKGRSKFCTDVAGTVLCAANGDPIAFREDISGNGNHMIQPTSPNCPVYYTDGAIQWERRGAISGVARYANQANDYVFRSNGGIYGGTLIVVGQVFKIGATNGGNQNTLSTWNNATGSLGPSAAEQVYIQAGSTALGDIYLGGSTTGYDIATDPAHPFVEARVGNTGAGSGPNPCPVAVAVSTLSPAYGLGWTYTDIGVSPGRAVGTGYQYIDSANPSYQFAEVFLLLMDRVLSSDDYIAVLKDIQASFTGWAP